MATDLWGEGSQMLHTIVGELEREFEIRAMSLTGSIAAGLGSPTSDVDHIAVVDPHEGSIPEWYRDRDFIEGNRLYDVELLTPAQLARVHAAMERQISPYNYFAIFDLRRQIRTATRICMSRPIDGWQPVRDLVGAGFEAGTRRRAMALYAADGMTFIRDTAGFLASGDLATATETSARGLRCALEMVLLATGDFNYSGKFLVRRLTDVGLPETAMQSVLSLLSIRQHGQAAALADESRSRIRAAASFAAWAQVYGWDVAAPREVIAEIVLPADHSMARVDAAFPCRTDSGVVFFTTDGQVVSTAADLVLWQLLGTNSDLDWVGSRFAGLTGLDEVAVHRWVQQQIEVHAEAGLLQSGS